VRLALVVAILTALFEFSWIALAPNRLVSGEPVLARHALGSSAFMIAALAILPEALGRRGHLVATLVLLGALALALVSTGGAAKALLQGRPPSARVMLGSGFWVASVAMVLLAVEHARAARQRWASPLILGGLAAIVAACLAGGALDRLSLVVEYKARLSIVHAAFHQHVVLALGALSLALAVALPLGWLAFRSPRTEAVTNAVLGAIQVTPAIALFGLLIPLLAGLLDAAPDLRRLGIGAIGAAPALLGVAVYLALPLFRGLVSGLRATDPAVVEAAQAMGMTESRTTVEVRIPLGLPILLGALRVAAVQSIGLMTLGGLIGAGGLGAVVFEGMSQLAADLILLGSIPIIGLALAVDAGMVWTSRILGFSK
jgi:osmoprotectant transport system permease protein